MNLQKNSVFCNLTNYPFKLQSLHKHEYNPALWDILYIILPLEIKLQIFYSFKLLREKKCVFGKQNNVSI